MTSPTLVVMAAGIGSRFGGLKQLAPIGPQGEVTVAYSIYDALRAGFGRVVFIIRQEMEAEFRERIGHFAERRAETKYVFQSLDRLPAGFRTPADRTRPWGTGHAILCCREAVDTPFAVINADDLYGPDAYRVVGRHLQNVRPGAAPWEFCMPGFILRNSLSPHGHVARGVCQVSPDGCLVGITERTKIQRVDGVVQYEENGRWTPISPDTYVSMNMWGFTPELFPELERRFVRFLERNAGELKAEYFIPTVVGDLVQEGKARVRVLETRDTWYGVTYKEDLPFVQQAVREMIRLGIYPERL